MKIACILSVITLFCLAPYGACSATEPMIAAGNAHTLALAPDGTILAWGDNGYGQLGDWTKIDRESPVRIPGFGDVEMIAAGYGHSVALKSDGTVWTWQVGQWRLRHEFCLMRRNPQQSQTSAW